MRRTRLDRRQYMEASVAAAAAVLAAPAAQALAQAVPMGPARLQEAPALAALVRDRKLQPVEQRLPKDPLVVTPVERSGVYGGVWRMGILGVADKVFLTRTMDYENLVRWDLGWTQIIPNVATGWEATPDGTAYTFYLREGLRWSDGQPLTADDLVFWHQDVLLNKTLTPALPLWLMIGDEPVRVEKLDPHTVRFVFPVPHGLFLQFLATPRGSSAPEGSSLLMPAHYLKQWHLDHNRAGVEAALARGLAQNWPALWALKADSWLNPELPTLHPWRVTTPVGQGTRTVLERNPYYWKVDTEGKQLPYLDQVVFELHERVETIVLKALNGEIDMQDRHLATNQNKPVFFDNQGRGNYTFYETLSSFGNRASIGLNLTHKDPEKRRIFADQRFRIALSLAINRQEVIDIVYVGLGQPANLGPLESSPFFHERLAYQYTEYDPDRANQLLDEMGLTRRDARGMRLRLDGQPLHLDLEVIAGAIEPWADCLELVKKHWAAVGVDMDVVAEERSFFTTRRLANEQDAGIFEGGPGMLDSILEPWVYMPFDNFFLFGGPWLDWWKSGGVEGEEPPEPTKRQMALHDQIRRTADPEEQRRLFMEILDIAADEFYMIGLTRPAPGYGIVRKDFHNVPASMPAAWLYPNPAPTNPAQYFTTRR